MSAHMNRAAAVQSQAIYSSASCVGRISFNLFEKASLVQSNNFFL